MNNKFCAEVNLKDKDVLISVYGDYDKNTVWNFGEDANNDQGEWGTVEIDGIKYDVNLLNEDGDWQFSMYPLVRDPGTMEFVADTAHQCEVEYIVKRSYEVTVTRFVQAENEDDARAEFNQDMATVDWEAAVVEIDEFSSQSSWETTALKIDDDGYTTFEQFDQGTPNYIDWFLHSNGWEAFWKDDVPIYSTNDLVYPTDKELHEAWLIFKQLLEKSNGQ